MLSPYAQGIFIAGGIYAIAALGLYVAIASGQFSVAHAALMGLGGYGAAVASVALGAPFWLALLAGAAVGGAAGAAFAVLLRAMGGMLLGVATIALGQAISLTVTQVPALGGSLGYTGVPIRTTLGWTALVLLVALAALAWLLRSSFGIALLAAGRDETVAGSLGISTFAVRVWAFGLGGALAGVAGALQAHWVGLVDPNSLGFLANIPLYVFLVVGGSTTPWGAVAGAVGLTWLLELLRFSQTDRYWVLGLLLAAAVLVRPQGLLVRRSLRAPAARAAAPGRRAVSARSGR